MSSSHVGGVSGDSSKMQQWQVDQNYPHKSHGHAVAKALSEKVSSSPKPPLKHPSESSESKLHMNKSADLGSLTESAKRSHPDWGNCVEGTKPQLVKRRKLYGFNCGKLVLIVVGVI